MRIALYVFSILFMVSAVISCGKKPEEAQPAAKDTVAVVEQSAPPVKDAPRPKPAVKTQPKPKPKRKPVAKKGTIKEEDLPRYVQALKPRIQRLYKTRSQVVPMQGSMKITVLFAASGDVKSVDITPDLEAQLTDSFVDEVREIVKGWHLDVEKQMSYSFRMSFYQ